MPASTLLPKFANFSLILCLCSACNQSFPISSTGSFSFASGKWLIGENNKVRVIIKWVSGDPPTTESHRWVSRSFFSFLFFFSFSWFGFLNLRLILVAWITLLVYLSFCFQTHFKKWVCGWIATHMIMITLLLSEFNWGFCLRKWGSLVFCKMVGFEWAIMVFLPFFVVWWSSNFVPFLCF